MKDDLAENIKYMDKDVKLEVPNELNSMIGDISDEQMIQGLNAMFCEVSKNE